MEKEKILSATEALIKTGFSGESTGHDYHHIERVVKMARKIAAAENADIFLVELVAWLHDLGDYKLHDGIDKSEEMITHFMNKLEISQGLINTVVEMVSQVSFSKGKVASTLEAQIVQDADRLDALGAIGIARVFAYGGKKEREIWNPQNPELTSIQHFYDKLLRLKDLMHTTTAKKMAEDRHAFLQEYLRLFYLEWEGKPYLE